MYRLSQSYLARADYFTVGRGGKQYVVRIEGNPMKASSNYFGGFGAESVAELIPPNSVNGIAYRGNMTFDVNGTAEGVGPFAYFNVTIPNNLMNCSSGNNWVVELDSVPQSAVLVSPSTQNTTVSLVFSYPNSPSPYCHYTTQTIEILSNNIASGTTSTISDPLIARFHIWKWSNLNAGAFCPWSAHLAIPV